MDNSNNKKATIKDVAQFAGVSTATVERALRNSDRIKKETRQRVLEAINVLNYQTNDVARALQSHRNYNILAVYHRTPEYFTVEFERGFHAAQQQLASRGLTLITKRARSLVPQDAIQVLQQVDYSTIDAVLLDCGGSELDSTIRAILEKNIPVATFGSDSPSSGRVFYVGEDPFISGQVAADIAIQSIGRSGRYITFQGPTSVYALNRRTDGFTAALQERFPEMELLPPVNHEDDDSLALRKALDLLNAPDLPDCIFCNSAAGAIALNRAIIYNGMPSDRLPLIIGYDLNSEIYDMLQHNRCFCTIYQNPYLEAVNAVNYMFEYLLKGVLPQFRDLQAYSHVVFKHSARLYIS